MKGHLLIEYKTGLEGKIRENGFIHQDSWIHIGRWNAKAKFAYFFVILFGLFPCTGHVSHTKENVPNSEIVLNFVPYMQNAPFKFKHSYSINQEFRIKLLMLSFYISELTFLSDQGGYLAKEISLLRLQEKESQIKSELPKKKYTSLQFGIGIPPVMNDTASPAFDIMNYSRSHPLSFYSNMFWNEKSGYTFLKFEGKVDPHANSSDPLFQKPLLYHVGTNPYYKKVNLKLPSSIFEKMILKTLTLIIDLDQMFSGLDPLNNHDTQTMDNPALARKVIDRFAQSFRIKVNSDEEN